MFAPSGYVASFDLAEPKSFRNLTMLPLLARVPCDAGYVTLDQAVPTGRFRVTEVSEAGRVPELRVTNDLDLPVLLLDGEELVGAKQNRIVNLTVLVPAKSALTIPVSCVEAGRWNQVSAEFRPSNRTHFAEGRARKAQQVSAAMSVGSRASDQGDVWNRVSARVAGLATPSPTSAMADAYDQVERPVDEYVEALTPVERQAGAAFVTGGRLLGIELFDAPETLHRILPKIVRSYALDLVLGQLRQPLETPPADLRVIEPLLGVLDGARPDEHQAIGLGTDVRWNSASATAAALQLNDRVVHFVAFPLGNDENGAGSHPGSRLQSPSWRRQRHS